MYDCRSVKGHIEIYYNDEFLCSADTPEEALEEIEEHRKNMSE